MLRRQTRNPSRTGGRAGVPVNRALSSGKCDGSAVNSTTRISSDSLLRVRNTAKAIRLSGGRWPSEPHGTIHPSNLSQGGDIPTDGGANAPAHWAAPRA